MRQALPIIPQPPKASLDEILTGFAGSDQLPGYLRISLLEQCNERCFFCHNEGYEGRQRVIDEEVLWSAVKASLKLGKDKFKFTGGEPTAHPKLPTYIAHLKRLAPHAEIGITTNGTQLYGLAEELAGAGLSSATVSLHSLDRSNYKRITGLDGLSMALKGLESLTGAGIEDITINMVVSTVNASEVHEMGLFAAANGYGLRLLDILPTRTSLLKVRVPAKEMRERFPDAAIKPKIYHPKCSGCKHIPLCGEGEYLRLSANGTLDPCMYREDLKIQLSPGDTEQEATHKVALGFRRIVYDNI